MITPAKKVEEYLRQYREIPDKVAEFNNPESFFSKVKNEEMEVTTELFKDPSFTKDLIAWAASNNDVESLKLATPYFNPNHNIAYMLSNALVAGKEAGEGKLLTDKSEFENYAAAHFLVDTYGRAVAYDDIDGNLNMQLPSTANNAPHLAAKILRDGKPSRVGMEALGSIIYTAFDRKNKTGNSTLLDEIFPVHTQGADVNPLIKACEHYAAICAYGQKLHDNDGRTPTEITQNALDVMSELITKGYPLDGVLAILTKPEAPGRVTAEVGSVVACIEERIGNFGDAITVPENVQAAFDAKKSMTSFAEKLVGSKAIA